MAWRGTSPRARTTVTIGIAIAALLLREARRDMQLVVQDPFSSLNPRQLVKDIVGRPLKVHREASGGALRGS